MKKEMPLWNPDLQTDWISTPWNQTSDKLTSNLSFAERENKLVAKLKEFEWNPEDFFNQTKHQFNFLLLESWINMNENVFYLHEYIQILAQKIAAYLNSQHNKITAEIRKSVFKAPKKPYMNVKTTLETKIPFININQERNNLTIFFDRLTTEIQKKHAERYIHEDNNTMKIKSYEYSASDTSYIYIIFDDTDNN